MFFPINVPLVARLAADGNGIELVDSSIGSGVLTVTPTNGSTAARDLGLTPSDQASNSSTTSRASYRLLPGADAPALA